MLSSREILELSESLYDLEKISKKTLTLKEIQQEYNLTRYSAVKVRFLTDLFHDIGNKISSYNSIIKALETEIKQLKKSNNNKQQEHGKLEYILNKIEESISDITIPDYDILDPIHTDYDKDITDIVLLISDLHIGEKVQVSNPFGDGYVNEYNYEIAKKRLNSILTKLEQYTKIHRNLSKIIQCHIILLGDIVSGQNLHDDLDMTNEFHIADQTIKASQLITNMILRVSRTFQKIQVYGVPGNHGRTNKKKLYKYPNSSFDYLAYKITEAQINSLSNKIKSKITFHISKGSFLIREICGHNILMLHGDNIKSWAGIPYYGMMRDYSAKQELSLALTNQPIHYIVMGHFHHPITINKAIGGIIVNGSLKGFDEYSIDMNYITPPSQTMFGISKKYGKTFLYELVPDEDL